MNTIIKSILPVLVVVGCAHKSSPFQQEVRAQAQNVNIPPSNSARAFTKSFKQAGKVFEATDWVKDPNGSAFVRFVRVKSGTQIARNENFGASSIRLDVPAVSTNVVKETKQDLSRVAPEAVASNTPSVARVVPSVPTEALPRPAAQDRATLTTAATATKPSAQPLSVGLEPSITPPLEGPLAQAPVRLDAPKTATPDLSKATELASVARVEESPRFKLADRPQSAVVSEKSPIVSAQEQATPTQVVPARGLLGKLLSLPTYIVAWSAIILIVTIFVFAVFLYRLHIDSIIQKRR